MATRLLPSAGSRARAGLRRIATCASKLRPAEEKIGLGVRARLAALDGEKASIGGAADGAPRVAVMGRHSLEFAAAVRAVRAVGATSVPVDTDGRDVEALTERLAEVKARMAVVVGEPGGCSQEKAREAAQRLGASVASAAALFTEGASTDSGDASGSASVLFYGGGSGPLRAAEVPDAALRARLACSTGLWGFGSSDTVLSLGLDAEAPAALVDALEAPLAAGASVSIPSLGSDLPLEEAHLDSGGSAVGETSRPWEFWAAIRDEADTSVIFIASKWLRSLLAAHEGLSPQLRRDLAGRWADRPLRHAVAVAPLGTVPSQELSRRWASVFGGPLTWYFSSAEAGSLYTVLPAEGPEDGRLVGRAVPGLEWAASDQGNLLARGSSLFSGYFGRPRSTAEALDAEGYFCHEGHHVLEGPSADDLLLQPPAFDADLDQATNRMLKVEPNVETFPRMFADWKVKKIPIRKYEMWRTAWGGILPTKKHNQVHKVYQVKYKRLRKR